MLLDDVLAPGLRVVFCGTALGTVSARIGAYYAGPGNRFWPTLHEVGLTPRMLEPREFRMLPRFGIGLTDVCKTRSGSDAEIGTAGFDVPRPRRGSRSRARTRDVPRSAELWTTACSRSASAPRGVSCCRRRPALRGAGGTSSRGASWLACCRPDVGACQDGRRGQGVGRAL